MAAKEPREDDEMDLINAEFESMVAGLNLDQSSPRTYLDELEDAKKVETSIPALPQRPRRNFRQQMSDSFSAIKRWWNSRGNDESDGAVV